MQKATTPLLTVRIYFAIIDYYSIDKLNSNAWNSACSAAISFLSAASSVNQL